MSTGQPQDPAGRLFEILTGRCRAQAVSAAAQIGLADSLADGPLSLAVLAGRLGCDEQRLERLLLYLVSLDVCRQDGTGYALTELGRTLSSEALGPLAAFLGAPDQWDPWSRLAASLAPGAPTAFHQAHGRDLYAYLAENAPAAARYDEAIEAYTRREALALAEVLDLSKVRHLVDLGGGRGTLLTTLLQRWPGLIGELVDLPDVLARTTDHVPAALAGRMKLTPGDFHDAVPAGVEAYLLSHVLHNWDDRLATDLLARCARGLAPGGRVFVLETLLLPGERAHLGRHLDLEMLVLTGGRERSKVELRRMFREAGLVLEATQAVTTSSWLLIGRLEDARGC